MKQIQKTLKKGVHILGLPINEATSLNDLFPKEPEFDRIKEAPIP